MKSLDEIMSGAVGKDRLAAAITAAGAARQ